MIDLLYQLTNRPPSVTMIWVLLFILTISSMFNFIISFDEDTKKFKAIITTLTIFLGFLSTFTLFNKHIGDSGELPRPTFHLEVMASWEECTVSL